MTREENEEFGELYYYEDILGLPHDDPEVDYTKPREYIVIIGDNLELDLSERPF